jgi:hypothetical protein
VIRKLALLLGAAGLLPFVGHGIIRLETGMSPPAVELPRPDPARARVEEGGVVRVFLSGSPEAIGAAHGRRLRERMLSEEAELWKEYERLVPWWIARVGIEDYSRVRFRHLDLSIPDPRRREIAAESLALEPDPFVDRMPTYQRMMFLHAIYDIALPFEHSPVIGCTSFGFDGSATADGHTLVARAFDFETSNLLDKAKAVFLVREDGAIPFASVAWPGFVGVVTGMNAAGVFVAVHGGRAGEPVADGLPVAFSLRQVLEQAHDAAEAVAILRAQHVMVSHIVFVADGAGHLEVVERAPGHEAYVRDAKGQGTLAVTNHFEGPLAADPSNLRVRETSSTLARRARIDALLAGVGPHGATPETALAMLRDHRCAGDPDCPLGDRRAIDAVIATHGVVADTTDRILWVSAGPHLLGRFVKLDLRELLAADPPPGDGEAGMPEDPIYRTAGDRWAE